MVEKFCLKWNDFEENIATSFKKLRGAEDFYDVTLVTDDQHQVSAHKVVLAASSEYFKNVLKSNKHSHPLLCLTDVGSSELNNILDYIYNGEVKIQQDRLEGFLQMADRFKVQGLVPGDSSDTSMGEVDFKNRRGKIPREENVKNYVNPLNIQLNDTTNITYKPKDPLEECKDEHKTALGKHFLSMVKEEENPEKMGQTPVMESTEFGTTKDLDRSIRETLTKQEDGYYCCQYCGKTIKKLRDATEHAETHMEGLSFPCQYCDKSFRSRNVLRGHVNRSCPKRPQSKQ